MHFKTPLALFSAIATLAQPALGLIYGVDSSTLVSTATFTRALSQGFTKAVPRGYQEACGSGGRVDPNFVQTYKNARAAGYTDIDMYWFPCTGANNACKSFSTQLAEISSTFRANSMQIGRIWIDIERDVAICNNWNYGTTRNREVAGQIIAAAKASGFKYGIYSSPGEWSGVFGSSSFNLDSAAPLWFATWDNVQNLNMRSPFGGWTSAFGKQYTDQSASGQFDLNVFAS